MGVRIQDRVKLDSVLEAKARGGCLWNCLREVGERYILDQRYMAWAQKYEVRATWIMQMLNAFYQRTKGMRGKASTWAGSGEWGAGSRDFIPFFFGILTTTVRKTYYRGL
jgi:hypothetical protein